ncbi:CoA-binding protein [Halogeometricum sp. S3BR5-2]|uniref:acetate--CoA ligase (ADP-forming) n=1 Tax=Halogeometricum luteum TaxID=2950537 RepID=A0ABU2G6E3_9EURY|nr:CoA-binding protein [Halogeometricum sp. S3BR5-2]MDS0295718.1 CoA-binding protein [Halogeometricum sp. S3BR5-2]
MTRTIEISRLFDPSSIAVVGASTTEGKIGYEAMENVRDFEGPVYPVNPSREGEIFGESFVGSIGAIDDDVDLALLCVPASVVPDTIEECGEAGVGAAVIYAGGFAEAGEDGRELQRRITASATEHGIALLGPNTSGFVVPDEGLYASFATGVEDVPAGGLAVIAQSGGIAHSVAFRAVNERRGLSAMVGLGNRANVGFEEAIDYFDSDPSTSAIALHLEGTDDARSLLETCYDAETPVFAYKVGTADVSDFAESHTGALTGDHALYEAGFAQYGVPTVESTSQLLDAGHLAATAPLPRGTNVGIVTAQAGPGIVIADRLKQAGVSLPSLSEETTERVTEILPGITYAANPVDTGRPMPAFGDVVRAVAEDTNVDAVVVYELHEAALGFPVDALDGLAEETGKPVLFATAAPHSQMEADRTALEEIGVSVFESPEDVADAMVALAEYARVSASAAPAGVSTR